MSRLILIELNEVPYRIVDLFCAAQPGSCLARLLPRCSQFETLCPDRGGLSPWITWPTLHRGVNNEIHAIRHLGEELHAVDAAYPPVWQRLVAAGVRTGVFGPLHSYPLPANVRDYAFYVPDTFAAGPECHPAALEPFQRFNLAMVHASARNVAGGVALGPAARLLMRAPRLGLRAATAVDVVAQLLAERRQRWKRVRRRTYQAVIAFDLFERLLAARKPDFANFFTNHVASAMHRYWAARFPDDYKTLDYPATYFATYRNEIEFAMLKFDGMLQRLVRRADRDRDTVLAIASSMGQAASLGQSIRDQVYIRDLDKLLESCGLERADWSRRMAMDPDVAIRVREDKVQGLAAALKRVRVHGAPIWCDVRPGGFVNMSLDVRNVGDKPRVATVNGNETPFDALGLAVVPIEDQAGETGYHIPEGVFLVYDPHDSRPDVGRRQIASTAIAPWILRRFDCDVPTYMRGAEGDLPSGMRRSPAMGAATAAARPSRGIA